MINDHFFKKNEYLEFNKYIKISSFSLVFMILFIYFSRNLSINSFIFFIDVAISISFISSTIIVIIKVFHLIQVVNLDIKDNFEYKKLNKFIGVLFLFLIFIMGLIFLLMQTNYQVSANVLGTFLMSIPLLSLYLIFKNRNK